MKGENPFTLTFGQKPVEFISRTDQIGKIINTFDMENPSNMVYMIAGVRRFWEDSFSCSDRRSL